VHIKEILIGLGGGGAVFCFATSIGHIQLMRSGLGLGIIFCVLVSRLILQGIRRTRISKQSLIEQIDQLKLDYIV
jgi:hypothetical protein